MRSRVGDVQANVGREETRVARVCPGFQGESDSELSSTGSEESDEGSAEHGEEEGKKKKSGGKRLWVNS